MIGPSIQVEHFGTPLGWPAPLTKNRHSQTTPIAGLGVISPYQAVFRIVTPFGEKLKRQFILHGLFFVFGRVGHCRPPAASWLQEHPNNLSLVPPFGHPPVRPVGYWPEKNRPPYAPDEKTDQKIVIVLEILAVFVVFGCPERLLGQPSVTACRCSVQVAVGRRDGFSTRLATAILQSRPDHKVVCFLSVFLVLAACVFLVNGVELRFCMKL